MWTTPKEEEEKEKDFAQATARVLLKAVKPKQAVVLKHNKPRPRVAHRGIAQFLGIGQKCNQVVPWSLHTFPENFTQIGPAVFS